MTGGGSMLRGTWRAGRECYSSCEMGKVAKDTVTEGLDGQGGKSGVTCRKKFLKSVEQKSDVIIFIFLKIFPYSMENKEADSKS